VELPGRKQHRCPAVYQEPEKSQQVWVDARGGHRIYDFLEQPAGAFADFACKHGHRHKRQCYRPKSNAGVLEVSNEKEKRKMARGLARRHRQTPKESLPQQAGGHVSPTQNAERGRLKKSPGLGTVAAICQAWAEPLKPNKKRAAIELAKLAGNISPHELTPLHFQSLLAIWKARVRRGTVYLYRHQLAQLVHHIAVIANRPDLDKQVPRAPRGRPRVTIATPAEVQKLLTLATPAMRCAILLATHAALRVSDALRISPAHYIAESQTLTITQKKTGQQVSIPVSEQLAAMLQAAPEADSPLIPFVERFHNRKVNYDGLNKAWNALKRKAQVNPELTFHDLRRTLAVSLYEVSKDLRVVEQMLGHQSLHSTAQYLEHRDPAKLRPYLDALFTPKGRVQ
jgi:integrase